MTDNSSPQPSGADRELVVAAYRGDCSWVSLFLDRFDRVSIYTKDPSHPWPEALRQDPRVRWIPLPNVGREAHTYLEHIVRHHGRGLADRTVFSQDGFSDHLRNDQFSALCRGERIVNETGLNAAWDRALVDYVPSYRGQPLAPSGHTHGSFYREFIGGDGAALPDTVPWQHGAYLVLRRDEIERRPLPVYERLLRSSGLSSHAHPEAAHYMERFWYRLFDESPVEKRR